MVPFFNAICFGLSMMLFGIFIGYITRNEGNIAAWFLVAATAALLAGLIL